MQKIIIKNNDEIITWEEGIVILNHLMEIAGIEKMIDDLKAKGRHDKEADDVLLGKIILLTEDVQDLRQTMRGRIDELKKQNNI